MESEHVGVRSAEVRAAYGARSAEYIELFGTVDAATAADRRLILDWARGVGGPVLDIGSGPGHWTDFLMRNGVAAEGIEMVPEFLDHARTRFPDVSFRAGRLPDLDIPDASAAGILSWFSLIHLTPDEMPTALAELARVIRPGGGLLVGFFTGERLEAFPHAVVTAYYWPVEELSRLLVEADFRVLATSSRADPGVRLQAVITAERTQGVRPQPENAGRDQRAAAMPEGAPRSSSS
ncbi:class I SAM-dependent methyltransferase [Microbacterium sp. NEAU-LLC]|uniref:Class I SAM-dependent methyltransferase n=1 Tax=Microbacterium helvum TaxID=2773713 RepID=A0ABR8NIG8_9MICO|nr:class I SAM-dependent methyltransferase [Microbacterium helvum]MBD3940490.1 class I SAM-dependent methyltransferase [Microbacterium helvum]